MDLQVSNEVQWLLAAASIVAILTSVGRLVFSIISERRRLLEAVEAQTRVEGRRRSIPIEVLRPDGSQVTVPLNPNNEESIRAFVEKAKGGPIAAAG